MKFYRILLDPRQYLRIIVLLVLISIAIASAVFAQTGSIEVVKTSAMQSGYVIDPSPTIRFLLRFNNNTGEKLNCSNAWKVSSYDGLTWDSTKISKVYESPPQTSPFADLFDLQFSLGRLSADGIGADTLTLTALGTASDPTKQMPSGWNDTSIVVTAYGFKLSDTGKHICIDSCSSGPQTNWIWSSPALPGGYSPTFSGLPGQPRTPGYGYCFLISEPCPLTPYVRNTGAICGMPYNDPSLTGTRCSGLSYNFDACNPCSDVDPIYFQLLSGPGVIDSVTGIWRWTNVPDTSVGHVYTVQVRVRTASGATSPAESMTVTVNNSQPVRLFPCQVSYFVTGEQAHFYNEAIPSGCKYSWRVTQVSGGAGLQFSIDSVGVLTLSAEFPGVFVIRTVVSDGSISDSCDGRYVISGGGHCCVGLMGNVDGRGVVDLSDLSAMVAFLTSDQAALQCFEAANVNKTGIVDLSDLAALVSYLTGGGYEVTSCP